MKILSPSVMAILLVLSFGAPSWAIDWQYPAIKGEGGIVSLPQAAVQPDPSLEYKVLFDLTGWPKMEGKVVPGLAKVARLLNAFDSAGMGPDKMKVVVVLHGPATEAVLKPELFQKKHGFANANLKLIDQLKKAGVKLLVCGQGLAEHDIAHTDVNPQFEITLSALVAVPTYELKGYAFLPFY
ncbi:MAG: DsrE family protein [Deltaproteobacteria bacterium]|nr:DsrE family protein [Deltaproteobacteria bacterium]